MKEEANIPENEWQDFCIHGCLSALAVVCFLLLLWITAFFAKVGMFLFDNHWSILVTVVLSWFFLIATFFSCIFLITTPKSEREAFLSVLSPLIGSVAKCDGSVNAEKINAIKTAFQRFHLTLREEQFCMKFFKGATSELKFVNEVITGAQDYAFKKGTWIVIYDVLWNIAIADNVLTNTKLDLLVAIARKLHNNLPETFFEDYFRRYSAKQEQQNPGIRSPIADAYSLLQVSEKATKDQIRNAYRARVKQLHPDLLRAQGLPDTLLGRANELMSQVNAAWELIKKSRGIN